MIRVIWILIWLSLCGYGMLSAAPRKESEAGALGAESEHLMLSGLSDLKRFIFSDLDGYVLLSLKAEQLAPQANNIGFLELPKHGVSLRSPVLSLKRNEASGSDWAKVLELMRELSLAEVQGFLLLQAPESQSWALSGSIERHPKGVLLECNLLDSSGNKQWLLMKFDPVKQKITISTYNPPK